ncbi:NADH-quinone oxidoreductase subunit N [Rubrobacter radiotolerans]|uniref:NADH-quinone oxidoreductase subunit N n=1 Tax=Rubrobacter radiotolerans TaxID=42256 RepID=A0AB35T629_RUBRA|nr:NADH-quinone oxidoreductase subunit N [Rubrobacter radiotolerans]MDX5895154.1 NADH-quinone oxidoreductase subunit N [Rubrobacter radiotolerans]
MSGMEGMNMGRDLTLLAPEIAVLLTAVGALIFEMVRLPRVGLPFTVVGLLVATGLSVPLIGTDTTVFTDTFRIDTLSVWAKLILLPATILSVLLSYHEVRDTYREGTVYSLFSFTALGALVLAGAGDMMFLVLGILLSSLGSFALVAYPRDDRATEAAMKYLVFGSVTSAIMIFLITFWFGATGSTLLSDLAELEGMPLAAAAGIVAVIVGLGYKAAIAPFHFWAPDAYDGGPLSVAAFLSVVPKVGAIFALAQVVGDLPPGEAGWPYIIAALAVLSMTYGNLVALVQDNVVRLLAYSSVAQAGYFLLGIVAVGRGDLALQSLVVFAAAYAAMNLGAFAIVALAGRDLVNFTGIGRSTPLVGAAMSAFLFSLVGIPPLGGFVGKLLLFGASLEVGFVWLAVVAILNSVLSLAVYLRIVVVMYTEPKGKPVFCRSVTVVWAVSLIATVGVGVAAQSLLSGIGL